MSLKPEKKRLSRNDLKRIHERRSEKAKQIDESLQASMPPTLRDWAKHPDQYDVAGIDYPEEWRHKDEVEELNMLKSYLPKAKKRLSEARERGEPTHDLKKQVKEFSERKGMLEWQRKHPFMSAGIGGDDTGYGKRNYDQALASGIDYGFNLRDPERSFLHNFHLKKHDVKGMRVILEKNNHKNPGARAWYVDRTRLFHLPPTKEFPNESADYARRTVIHEIGHHVHLVAAQNLNDFWSGMYYTWSQPVMRGKKYTGEITKSHVAPYEVIYNYRMYFGNVPVYFAPSYGRWKGRPLSKSDLNMSNLATKKRIVNEMWSETFSSYRMGEITKERKWARERIDVIDKQIVLEQRLMREFVGKKSSSEYRKMLRIVKGLERQKRVADAQYANLLKFERLLKRWDRLGWNPNFDREMEVATR